MANPQKEVSLMADGSDNPMLTGQVAHTTHITDSTTGTATSTLADVTVTPTQTLINNNFATVAAKIEAIMDALEAHGLVADA